MNRLRRLGWVYYEYPTYFITACTHDRRHLQNDPETHQVFREFCLSARTRHVWVGKYVLMPDHLHCMVCMAPDAPGLSIWMKSLKNKMSSHWRNSGIAAPHWQKGFFDHLLRSDQSHAEKWKYIHENPVRAGLVKDANDWPFAGTIYDL